MPTRLLPLEEQRRYFGAAEESPGGWYMRALKLRAAAARLDWLEAPPTDEEPAVSFLAEYCLLLGLSFENLLKGHITLSRMQSEQSPPLPKDCHIHRLERLASRIECQKLALSPADLDTLQRLSAFIEWAGRYPLPKRAEDMDFVYASSQHRDAEHSLWNRVATPLVESAWIMKGGPESMGGKRLYFRRP